jgi:hypothetical protein
VNALDPVNLWGRVFVLARPDGTRAAVARTPLTWLILKSGRPVLAAEAHGRALTTLAGWQPADLSGAIRALQSVAERPHAVRPTRRLEIATWDGVPVADTAAAHALVAAGFVRGDGRLAWEPSPASVRSR